MNEEMNKNYKNITLNDIGYQLVGEIKTTNRHKIYCYEKYCDDITYVIIFYYDKYCLEATRFYKETYIKDICKEDENYFTVEEIYACANL